MADNNIDFKDRLCKEVEHTAGYKVRTPNDFNKLKQMIYESQGILLSLSTLMRIWGYLKNNSVQTRESTLSILSKFVGYKDWKDFVEKSGNTDLPSSQFAIGKRINVKQDLSPGDIVRLRWLPDRKCAAVYLGDYRFRVVEVANTRLKPDDIFECHIIIYDQPLYLDNLDQNDGEMPKTYLCGQIAGIQYSVVKNDKKFLSDT